MSTGDDRATDVVATTVCCGAFEIHLERVGAPAGDDGVRVRLRLGEMPNGGTGLQLLSQSGEVIASMTPPEVPEIVNALKTLSMLVINEYERRGVGPIGGVVTKVVQSINPIKVKA